MKWQCTGVLSCQRPGYPDWSTCSTCRWYAYAAVRVGAEHPVVVVGHVEAGGQAPGQEMLREQHRALRRPIGRVVVDRLEPGIEQVEHAVGLAGGLEPRVVVVPVLGRGWHRPVRFPAEQ